MKNDEIIETGCCKKFDPQPWDENEFEYQDKLFLKDHVTSLFHIPLNFGSVMERDAAKIEAAGAHTENDLVLTDENSLWGADVYIAVDKEVPEAKMERLSGTFISKVFEGPYREMKSFVEEMDAFVKSKGKTIKKSYFYYTYCPKCSETYGKNYIVILAQV